MKRSIILGIMVILLVGINFGYYQPKVRSLEQTVSSLEQTVSRQESQISTQETTIATQGARIKTQVAQISTLASEKSKLEQTVSTQETQIATRDARILNLQTDLSSAQTQTQLYKGQVTTVTSQLSSSKKRLDNVLGITVTQDYQWTYQGRTWDWTLPISLSLYVEYRDRTRPQAWSSWVDMAKDTKDDPYIDQIFQKINDAVLEGHFTEVEKLNFVVAFVQSLPYTVDSVTTPYNEYPRYPIETLFDRGGDCEDTSILVAALLDRMGYDVALLVLKDAKHMAVGVVSPNAYGSYYTYKDKKYYYLETTGEGWKIGEIPSDITDTRASIYPLR